MLCFKCLHTEILFTYYIGFWPEGAESIPPEEVKQWSQWYLEGKASMLGLDETSVSQYEVDKYTAQVNIMNIVRC